MFFIFKLYTIEYTLSAQSYLALDDCNVTWLFAFQMNTD